MKVGRPADTARNYLIYQLAEAAPEILGKPGHHRDYWQVRRSLHGGPDGMRPARNRYRQGNSTRGEKAARKSEEVEQGTRIMIAGALGPKPDQIRPSFWDRIEVRNGVSAMAWPDHVNTRSARQACPGTKARAQSATLASRSSGHRLRRRAAPV